MGQKSGHRLAGFSHHYLTRLKSRCWPRCWGSRHSSKITWYWKTAFSCNSWTHGGHLQGQQEHVCCFLSLLKANLIRSGLPIIISIFIHSKATPAKSLYNHICKAHPQSRESYVTGYVYQRIRILGTIFESYLPQKGSSLKDYKKFS